MKQLLLLAALPVALLAQSLEGTWQGMLTPPNQNNELRVVFKITKNGNTHQGTLYSIDQNQQTNLGAITLQSNAVKIAIPGLGADYDGKFETDGNSITGTMTRGTTPIPLALKRATATTAWEIPPPPAPPKPMAADARLEFEVATIKPSEPGRTGRSAGFSNRRFAVNNYTLLDMITFAYEIHPSQVTNTPSWSESERYDIVAQPVAEGQPTAAQLKRMLQNLLTNRLGLAFHRDKKELSVFAITVAPGGPKLSPSASNEQLPSVAFRGRGNLPARNATMANLANVMQNSVLDRPVLDQTGIVGKFDFTLTWTPDEFQFLQSGPRPAAPTENGGAPDLFTAMREQLGLKLEGAKAPVEVFVVDKVSKPSEN